MVFQSRLNITHVLPCHMSRFTEMISVRSHSNANDRINRCLMGMSKNLRLITMIRKWFHMKLIFVTLFYYTSLFHIFDTLQILYHVSFPDCWGTALSFFPLIN